jgi:hypothetical protein
VYNNPAGIDMNPELLWRMFEAIDNVTIIKESAGDLSRMQRIDPLSGRLPFYNGSNSLVSTRCGRWRGLGVWRRRVYHRSPGSASMTQSAEANCQEHKRFTPTSTLCWGSSWQAGRPPRSTPARSYSAPAWGIRAHHCYRLTTRAALR